MSYSKFLDDVGRYIGIREKNNLPDLLMDKYCEDVRDEWIKEKRYKELISYIIEDYDSGNCDDFIEPLVNVLIHKKELALFKQLWKGIIRHRQRLLWDAYAFLLEREPTQTLETILRENIDNYNFRTMDEIEKRDRKKTVAFYRKFTLDGLEKYKKGLLELNDMEGIKSVEEIITTVANLEKPKPRPTTDKRKIDENIFWELIDSSRAESQDQFEFLEILKPKLETFHPKEIRIFQKILLTKINELNTWDVWALAYIVRRGCGDDEFDYFKAWVVSKGKKAFEDIKALNKKELISLFDEDPQLEQFMYLAEEVYEEKTNDFMAPARVKQSKIKGTKWDEDNLNTVFPELCELFKYESKG